MNNYFLNYEISKQLKELKFDGNCIAYYRDLDWVGKLPNRISHVHIGPIIYSPLQIANHNLLINRVSIPIYQQVLDWFETHHNILIKVNYLRDVNEWYYVIEIKSTGYHLNNYLENKTSDKNACYINSIIECIDIIKKK